MASTSHSSVKLFVGQIPKTITEDQLAPIFTPYGHVQEIVILRDRQTGQHKGCAFVIYSTKEEADTAIAHVHGQHILPPLTNPIQVKYADGQQEKVEHKLFVANMGRQATEEDVRKLFSAYGNVIEVAVLRELNGASKGCGFIKFDNHNSAVMAIETLNEKYRMEGATGNMQVRFAESEKEKQMKKQKQLEQITLQRLVAQLGGIGGLNTVVQNANALGMPNMGLGQFELMALNQSLMRQMSPAPSPQASGPPGCNLFIYHLPQYFTDRDLAVTFAPFGNVISAKVFCDKATGLSKCFGFVSYDSPAAAATAIASMNGFQIGNKRLKVQLKQDKQRPY